jgi:hypothetical protein
LVDWALGTSDPNEECRATFYEVVTCLDETETWKMIILECGQTPYPDCTPTGHGEGEEGYEYECTDEINNDCDSKIDCQESRCAVREVCASRCDSDKDNKIDKPCVGPDCYPNNPSLPIARENCFTPEDDDCDGKINCKDNDCNANRRFCPECDTDGDGVVSIDCDGTDCEPNNPAKPKTGSVFIENEWRETACGDNASNDCDSLVDCADSDCISPGNCGCAATEDCETPEDDDCDGSPNGLDADCQDIGGGDDDGDGDGDGDGCNNDECCGRGTHSECTDGECEPDVEICAYDPYTWQILGCETFPGECEPEFCVEVCN